MKIIDYKILFETDPSLPSNPDCGAVANLQQGVKDHLIDGWQPFGPPFVDPSSAIVMQAMVKYAPSVADCPIQAHILPMGMPRIVPCSTPTPPHEIDNPPPPV